MVSSTVSPIIVAIDGVSGSGKSTTAKTVARELGILHLDTGAMYRAVTYFALQKGLQPSMEQAVADLAAGLDMEVDTRGKLLVAGKDLDQEIRSARVTGAVSDFGKIPKVREILVALQRRIGSRQPSVVEGRDIGTVVFPEARFKFFMSASPEVRAQRRVQQLISMGLPANFRQVLKNLVERDEKDSKRAHSPLLKAPDAVEIDTSDLTFERQVAIIVSLVLKNRT
jgi:CMP/dCMP kinase